jgi:hypothetical protein
MVIDMILICYYFRCDIHQIFLMGVPSSFEPTPSTPFSFRGTTILASSPFHSNRRILRVELESIGRSEESVDSGKLNGKGSSHSGSGRQHWRSDDRVLSRGVGAEGRAG